MEALVISALLADEERFVPTTEIVKEIKKKKSDANRSDVNKALYALEKQGRVEKNAEEDGTQPRWRLKEDFDKAARIKLLHEFVSAVNEELQSFGERTYSLQGGAKETLVKRRVAAKKGSEEDEAPAEKKVERRAPAKKKGSEEGEDSKKDEAPKKKIERRGPAKRKESEDSDDPPAKKKDSEDSDD